jgi:hypothetical protein
MIRLINVCVCVRTMWEAFILAIVFNQNIWANNTINLIPALLDQIVYLLAFPTGFSQFQYVTYYIRLLILHSFLINT